MKRENLKLIEQIIIGDNHFNVFSRELSKLAERIISLRYIHESTGVGPDVYFDKYANEFIGLLNRLEEMKEELKSHISKWDSLERDLIYGLARKYKPENEK